MTSDRKALQEHGLMNLKFGDIVLIQDHDNTYGRCYRKGAVSVGVIIHSDCKYAGHGPGVTTIMTSSSGKIKPVLSSEANIAKILKIGRFHQNS